jgi:hypothetical protein
VMAREAAPGRGSAGEEAVVGEAGGQRGGTGLGRCRDEVAAKRQWLGAGGGWWPAVEQRRAAVE